MPFNTSTFHNNLHVVLLRSDEEPRIVRYDIMPTLILVNIENDDMALTQIHVKIDNTTRTLVKS